MSVRRLSRWRLDWESNNGIVSELELEPLNATMTTAASDIATLASWNKEHVAEADHRYD